MESWLELVHARIREEQGGVIVRTTEEEGTADWQQRSAVAQGIIVPSF